MNYQASPFHQTSQTCGYGFDEPVLEITNDDDHGSETYRVRLKRAMSTQSKTFQVYPIQQPLLLHNPVFVADAAVDTVAYVIQLSAVWPVAVRLAGYSSISH